MGRGLQHLAAYGRDGGAPKRLRNNLGPKKQSPAETTLVSAIVPRDVGKCPREIGECQSQIGERLTSLVEIDFSTSV